MAFRCALTRAAGTHSSSKSRRSMRRVVIRVAHWFSASVRNASSFSTCVTRRSRVFMSSWSRLERVGLMPRLPAHEHIACGLPSCVSRSWPAPLGIRRPSGDRSTARSQRACSRALGAQRRIVSSLGSHPRLRRSADRAQHFVGHASRTCRSWRGVERALQAPAHVVRPFGTVRMPIVPPGSALRGAFSSTAARHGRCCVRRVPIGVVRRGSPFLHSPSTRLPLIDVTMPWA